VSRTTIRARTSTPTTWPSGTAPTRRSTPAAWRRSSSRPSAPRWATTSPASASASGAAAGSLAHRRRHLGRARGRQLEAGRPRGVRAPRSARGQARGHRPRRVPRRRQSPRRGRRPPGTRWAVERLAELAPKRRNAVVCIDAGGMAASLIPALIEAGVKVVAYSTRDVVRACGSFVDKVDEDELRHPGQPELALAVDGARKRKVGEAWLWHRRDTSVDISPLQALTLAVYGLKEERPKKEVRPLDGRLGGARGRHHPDGGLAGRHRPGQPAHGEAPGRARPPRAPPPLPPARRRAVRRPERRAHHGHARGRARGGTHPGQEGPGQPHALRRGRRASRICTSTASRRRRARRTCPPGTSGRPTSSTPARSASTARP
jgi:hypothetical protein